ncbi:hypothetical protein KC19_12G082900 [Ceratodon purpureus]|uniref:WRC domain-containing protein n=1 Tax=Ceratodon purpureus TaxID=3225 RepID=A0A8T0G5I9_CERPU|nr:hypothetical protein KC19_12G082900 [Ceratodon purpureus]
MRIRKGHRLAPAVDRTPGPRDEGILSGGINQIAEGVIRDIAAAGVQHDGLERANGTLEAAAESADVDLGRKRVSADGYSRSRPQISEGVGLSISSIIQAGKSSPKSNSSSAPASAESVLTSDTSVAKGTTDCSPFVAMKALDQPMLLLQSLKCVCTAAGDAGLTAKEAVARITDQGLPGLNEGGERLIVQVAKSFRGSSFFVEERGRYFIQESLSLKEKDYGMISSDTGYSSSRRDSGSASEIETAIEAARQLQNLQMIPESAGDDVGFNGREEKSVADRRVGTSRSKKGAKLASSSSREQSGPRCNRDDGKGWRCFRPAESGFSLCKYHRDQIRRAEIRRRRSKNKSKDESPVNVSNPTPKEAANAVIPDKDIVKIVDADLVESDDELPDQKRRRGVKAKSLKSIM